MDEALAQDDWVLAQDAPAATPVSPVLEPEESVMHALLDVLGDGGSLRLDDVGVPLEEGFGDVADAESTGEHIVTKWDMWPFKTNDGESNEELSKDMEVFLIKEEDDSGLGEDL